MARVYDSTGQIKCQDEKGNIKWFSPAMVLDGHALRMFNIKVVDGPEPFEPKFIETKNEVIPLGTPKSNIPEVVKLEETKKEEFKINLDDDDVEKEYNGGTSEITIDDFTKDELADLLRSSNVKFNIADKKEILFEAYLKLNK